ncbi:hypothetical protein HanPI659440_Chr04g0157291 [Helianthus annuus]|nr:hypothetical protein HanPI659440_Chr04g0157291 [Helianthus annuus]
MSSSEVIFWTISMTSDSILFYSYADTWFKEDGAEWAYGYSPRVQSLVKSVLQGHLTSKSDVYSFGVVLQMFLKCNCSERNRCE